MTFKVRQVGFCVNVLSCLHLSCRVNVSVSRQLGQPYQASRFEYRSSTQQPFKPLADARIVLNLYFAHVKIV